MLRKLKSKMISLYLTDPSKHTDKEYHILLEIDSGSSSDYNVIGRFGKRGAASSTDVKCSKVPLSKALTEFNKLLNSKTKKGYTTDTSGRPFAPCTAPLEVLTDDIPNLQFGLELILTRVPTMGDANVVLEFAASKKEPPLMAVLPITADKKILIHKSNDALYMCDDPKGFRPLYLSDTNFILMRDEDDEKKLLSFLDALLIDGDFVELLIGSDEVYISDYINNTSEVNNWPSTLNYLERLTYFYSVLTKSKKSKSSLFAVNEKLKTYQIQTISWKSSKSDISELAATAELFMDSVTQILIKNNKDYDNCSEVKITSQYF